MTLVGRRLFGGGGGALRFASSKLTFSLTRHSKLSPSLLNRFSSASKAKDETDSPSVESLFTDNPISDDASFADPFADASFADPFADDPFADGALLNARADPLLRSSTTPTPVDQPENPRQLVVALLGAPNSGKSTLANRLVGRKLCSVSKRVDTTLRKTLAVATEGETQLVFFDAPGIVDPYKRKHYADPLLRDPHTVVSKADVVVVVVDVDNKLARKALHPEIVKVLHMRQDKETVLLLNKIDLLTSKEKLLNSVRLLTDGVVGGRRSDSRTLEVETERRKRREEKRIHPKDLVTRLMEDEKTSSEPKEVVEESKETLQEFIRRQEIPCPDKNWNEYKRYLKWLHPRVSSKTSWTEFSRVFLVSALEADGTDEVKEYLMEAAIPGPWTYPHDVLTDQNPREIVLLTVREKLLDHVPQDVPYNLKLFIIDWKIHDLFMEIHVGIGIRRRTRSKMIRDSTFILGRSGDAIKRVSVDARRSLMDTFLCDISLKLHVKNPKFPR